MDTDSRGVKRGKCRDCPGCDGYKHLQQQPACSTCGCPPGRHLRVDESDTLGYGAYQKALAGAIAIGTSGSQPQAAALEVSSESSAFNKCSVCDREVYLDLNTGNLSTFCKLHLKQQPPDLQFDSSEEEEMANVGGATAHVPNECAIDECHLPCYVDANGTVHDCCGYTHAMELIRRQVISKMKQKQIVKGVSHCLLPECNRVTWPFMNYCGRTHAQEGKRRGLIPPITTAAAIPAAQRELSKDSSLCELPGCSRRKYTESGKVFDFCGRKHAEEAQRRRKIAPQQASDPKDDSLCIVPECANLKYKDPNSGKEHDFCGRTHAEEARRRNIKPPQYLISMSDVKTFLKTFSNLIVVEIRENEYAKPGGVLYKKFIATKNALPQSDRKTCLAFHGTSEENVDSICKEGYDPGRRSGQAYGPGEYFATTPNIPLSYCKGGKKMLLNELLLGQDNVHHTKTGDIIVMKNPEHDLPRFVVTFQ